MFGGHFKHSAGVVLAPVEIPAPSVFATGFRIGVSTSLTARLGKMARDGENGLERKPLQTAKLPLA
jgi:hypothetical protein